MAFYAALLAGVDGVVFLLLAAVLFWRGFRHHVQSNLFLGLSIGLLGIVLLPVDQIDPQLALLRYISGIVSLAAFYGSAWSLVLFRNHVVRYRLPVVLGTGFLSFALVLFEALGGRWLAAAAGTPEGYIAVAVLLGAWVLFVAEPLWRLGKISTALPAVQKGRVRALLGTYLVIVALLVAIIVVRRSLASSILEISIYGLLFASLPLLYASLSPPTWLRRVWRGMEEEQYHEALGFLAQFARSQQELMELALSWATRLVGGSAACFLDPEGAVVASVGMARDGAIVPAQGNTLEAGSQELRIGERSSPGVVAPLMLGTGLGKLVVVSGPLSPVFGSDEVARLTEFALLVGIALARVEKSEALMLSDAISRRIMMDAPIGMAIVAQDGKFDSVNAAFANLVGYQQEELAGQDWSTIATPESLATLTTLYRKMRDQGEEHMSAEVELRRQNGSSVPVFISSSLIRERNAEPFYVMQFEDLTEHRLALEMADHALASAQELATVRADHLSRMSHELRTPLSSMVGYAELLELDNPREDQIVPIRAILRAGDHLLALINDVLDIARLDRADSSASMSLEPVDVHQTLADTVTMVQPDAASRGITIVLEDNLAAPWARADQQRLRQIWLNLLSNAVKYNRDGGRVLVTTTAVGRDRSRIRVAFADTGLGIPEERQALLFQPFERLGAERTEVTGTGLGLALARRLAEAMGATLDWESRPGLGSTFWVDLEAAATPTVAQGHPKPARTARPKALAGRPEVSVFYVEDNLANVHLVQRILEKRPYIRLVPAMQGSLALSLAIQSPPDLIILDLHLPDIGGREVLERLKGNPRTATIPVVILTADATPQQAAAIRELGVLAYLLKPIRVRQLLAVLDSLFEPEAATRSSA